MPGPSRTFPAQSAHPVHPEVVYNGARRLLRIIATAVGEFQRLPHLPAEAGRSWLKPALQAVPAT